MKYPIEHIIILFKENHTFDNYFGTFPGADGDATLAHAPNPPKSDHTHTHEAWLKRNVNPVKQQYQESDIPQYFACARQYTLCDHYFTDVAGPSTPNHLMVIAADSPVIDNPSKSDPTQPSLPMICPLSQLNWKQRADLEELWQLCAPVYQRIDEISVYRPTPAGIPPGRPVPGA